MTWHFGRDSLSVGWFDEITPRALLPYAFSFGTPTGRAFLVGWLGAFIYLDLEGLK